MGRPNRWDLHERIACARVLEGLAHGHEVGDPAAMVPVVMRGLAELLLDAQRWDDAELVRSCARALEATR